MEKNELASLPKRKLGPPNTEGPKKFKVLPVPSCKIRKNFWPTQKTIFLSGLGGVYTMENKNTNTEYQKVVRERDQKQEIVEIAIGIIYFLFEICNTVLTI